ncbi:MAG: NifB/NifX family molybdenum-iron cluster-binding protein [Desulfatiglandaceae bacterium]
MAKVGIPIFQSRVSPVFDTCTRLLLITFEQDREIERTEIYLDKLPLTERVNILRQLDVTVLICGGISDLLYNMLSNLKIRLITGIAGKADQVFDAFISNHLHEPRFFMPGYKTETP